MVQIMGAWRYWLRLVAVLAAFALLSAACGSDDARSGEDTTATGADEGATTDETEAPEDTADAAEETGSGPATGDPVMIGVISDETGPSQSRAIKVLQATADAINDQGGLNGHPIELVASDPASDVSRAQAAVADLPDDVIAVFLSTPATEAAVADALNDLGVPILGVGYNPSVWGGDISIFDVVCSEDNPDSCAKENFLTTAPTVEQAIAQQLTGAVSIGAQKATSAPCVEVDSCSASIPIFEAIGESLGLEMAPAVPISATAPDYSAECIGFVQDGIDFVQISAGAATAVNLVASCQDQGYEGAYGASAGSVDSRVIDIPAQFAGGLNGFPWFVDEPQVVEYREIMEGAGVPEEDWGYSHGTASYAALRLFQKAINDYADPDAPLDGAAALEAMFQVDGEDLDGLLASPVSFDPEDLDRTRTCFWSYIKDAEGNLENPNGGLATQCYPAE